MGISDSQKKVLQLISKLSARIRELENEKTQPVALIGLSCRFPEAHDAEEYWSLLRSGTDTIREVPGDRFDINSYYDPNSEAPGKTYTRFGGFIDEIGQFDAAFFGISPREAVLLDPQQRILLETAWRALENAGIAADQLVGSATGVFMGLSSSDYTELVKACGIDAIDAYMASGTAHSTATGRLSFLLDLHGPNMAIDTACSSSLVAVSQACKSLVEGDCDMALAGGVNLILLPETLINLSKARMLAPDGRCKTFDAGADGFVRAEGCGVVVLKRISDAERDGNRILAMIRGSAVNQDGASSGLTVPNGPAQERVITEALRRANISPPEVAYLECHGTGTSLGDPIEVQAAAKVLGEGRDPGRPLLIGSVKTNIGHLEAAAGVAGLIKVVLSMQQGVIPKQLHFNIPNPHIPWEQLLVKVVTEPTQWPEGRRIAGVSSFGFSGTNAHVVLEAYEGKQAVLVGGADAMGDRAALLERSAHMLAISGKTDKALRELAGRYVEWLADHTEADLGDVCFTAGGGRRHFEHRAGVLVESREQLTEALRQLAAGEASGKTYVGHNRQRPKVAFLFTGQGSQYVGMAQELYATQEVFRRALDRCAELLADELDEPLLGVIFGDSDGLVDQTRYTQPALFAIEAALYEMYKSVGVEPDVVLGHSVGEYAAAYAAGVFSLEDGLKLMARRGALFGALPQVGSMAAIFVGAERVQAAVDALNTDSKSESPPLSPLTSHIPVSVAAYNGAHVVISGPSEQVEEVITRFEAEEVRCARLETSHAFHSALLEPALEGFEEFAATIDYRPADRTLVSNLTGAALAAGQVIDAAYWRREAREPVQFARSVQAVAAADCSVLLELGPQPTLTAMALRCWPAASSEGVSEPRGIASLRRNRPADRAVIESMAQLYAAGCSLDFGPLDAGHTRCKLSLPTYPFQRQRYWVIARRHRPLPGEQVYPLLGVRQESASGEVTFTQTVGVRLQPWLGDYRVFGALVVPGAMYACCALSNRALPLRISRGQIDTPLVLADNETECTVQAVLNPREEGVRSFAFFSRDGAGQEWTKHATGEQADVSEAAPLPEALDTIRARLNEWDVDSFYRQMAERGVDYGPSLTGLTHVFAGSGEALGMIETPAELETRGMPLHPAMLDACWQSAAAASPREGGYLYMPSGWEAIELYAEAPLQFQCYVRQRIDPTDSEAGMAETITMDLWLVDAAEVVFGRVRGLTLKPVTRKDFLAEADQSIESWFYEVEWRERPKAGRIMSADFLAAPNVVALALRPATDTLLREVGIDPRRRCSLMDCLGRLSQAYVLQAFKTLGWSPVAGLLVESESLREQLGVIDAHGKLFGRLLAILSEAGVLRRDGAGWRVVPFEDAELEAAALLAELEANNPDDVIERALLSRCGEQLAEVLCGQVEPLGLLFPGEGLSAEQLYRDAPVAKVFNQLVQHSVRRAIAELPAGRTVRVIELGAGTGGTTGYVLTILPADHTEYLYTDLSAGFFDAAEQRFGKDYPFVEYRVLNIERDPEEQGFRAHHYDLILASNVLHATQDIGQTLAHCRKLLAPEGELIVLEGLVRQAWLDLTFGLLDGWWRFDDAVRKDYALMNVEQWRSVLADHGFRDIAAIYPKGAVDQAVLIAHGPRTVEQTVAPGTWLLAGDTSGAAAQLALCLADQGQHVVLVGSGPALTEIDDGHWQLRFNQADDWMALLEQLPDRAACGELRGVVHLAGLNVTESDSSSVERLRCDVAQAGSSALALTQALIRCNQRPTSGLWLITQGAQSIGEEPGGKIAGSTLWGMGKTIALEHPELNCRCLDVDGLTKHLDIITHELLQPDNEDQIVLRGQQRYVARLVRSQIDASREVRISPERTYLITGGLAGIGLAVARWLAARGALNVALNGRRAPNQEAETVIARLREQGVKVQVAVADVTQAEQLDSMLAELDATMPPLAGIFHSVGVLRDAALLNQTWDRFEDVLAPKVTGSWQLHRLTANYDLELFVLFASTAGVLGNRGQANHAAANAFLDQLAHHRRALGMPAVSIDWGAWAGIGEAEEQRERITDRLAGSGIDWIAPEQGMAALGRILGRDRPQVAVLPIDWRIFASQPSGQSVLLKELLVDQEPQPRRVAPQPIQRLQSIPADQRHPRLVEYLAEQVQYILRLPHAPDSAASFFDLGMDSLMAVELRNRLNADLKLDMPLRDLYEAANVLRLSSRIDTLLQSDQKTRSPIVRISRTDPLPLSASQESYWLYNPSGDTSWNASQPFLLTGKLDVPVLERCLSEIVRRHEALRTRFVKGANGPLQIIDAAAPVVLEVTELSESEVTERLRAQVKRPLDLQTGPAWRAELLRLGREKHVLSLILHHIVHDWTSRLVWARELVALYAAFAEGRFSPLPDLPVQYADFAHWQRRRMEGEDYERQVAYWQELLKGSERLRFPVGPRRYGEDRWPLARYVHKLPEELTEAITRLGREKGVTLYLTLLTAFQILLKQYTGQEDFLLVNPLQGRSQAELKDLIGSFAQPSLIRASLGGDPKYGDLLQTNRNAVLEAHRSQDVMFARLTKSWFWRKVLLAPFRSLSWLLTPHRRPLWAVFQILEPATAAHAAGLKIEFADNNFEHSNLGPGDLSVFVSTHQEISCDFFFRTRSFDLHQIEQMAADYQTLLQRITDDPDQRTSHLARGMIYARQ